MTIFLIYTSWIWPAVVVFGLAHGIKRLIEGNENYHVPLLFSSAGLFFIILTFIAILMQI